MCSWHNPCVPCRVFTRSSLGMLTCSLQTSLWWECQTAFLWVQTTHVRTYVRSCVAHCMYSTHTPAPLYWVRDNCREWTPSHTFVHTSLDNLTLLSLVSCWTFYLILLMKWQWALYSMWLSCRFEYTQTLLFIFIISAWLDSIMIGYSCNHTSRESNGPMSGVKKFRLFGPIQGPLQWWSGSGLYFCMYYT